MEFQFNNNLLLGVASSSAGYDDNWRDDLTLMKNMGVQCCRLSIDWSRVEPRDGCFDETVIACYREEIQTLKNQGIDVLLTLFHFNTPSWLEDRGGFVERDAITCFLRYVRKIVESLGDLVSEFITINEPNVYAYLGFFQGSWPPGRKSFLAMCRVMTHLAAAHIEAYGLIRKTRLQLGFHDTKVGVANHLRVFVPEDPENPLHRFWAERLEQLFQGSLTKAMCTGHAAFPVGKDPSIVPGEFCDFHGVSYFTRSTVSGPRDGVADGCAVNDLGWEIYPEGIEIVCRKVYSLLKRPIYITGNGVCDETDRVRARFIADHLNVICKSDLPVERYYYWCFRDDQDCAEGTSARFGLVHVDLETQRRSVMKSGEFFKNIIAERAVSETLFQEFCDVESLHQGECESSAGL